LQFFENDENGKNEVRVSELLTGKWDSIAVPVGRPHLLLGDTPKAQQKTASVIKNFVSLQGFTPKSWEQLGNNNA